MTICRETPPRIMASTILIASGGFTGFSRGLPCRSMGLPQT
jgi:hypothetical protein